jgi:hypothetical protein
MMRFVGRSKIGRLSSKGIQYPQLRLPRQYLDTIGKTAEIYETEDDGKREFLIVTQGRVSKSDAVLKPEAEVLKPQPYAGYYQRLSAIESQIAELSFSAATSA